MLAKTPLRDLALAWLETKDPQETYDYGNQRECACGQLAKHLGRMDEWLGRTTPADPFWMKLDAMAHTRHTFGELLQKAKEAPL